MNGAVCALAKVDWKSEMDRPKNPTTTQPHSFTLLIVPPSKRRKKTMELGGPPTTGIQNKEGMYIKEEGETRTEFIGHRFFGSGTEPEAVKVFFRAGATLASILFACSQNGYKPWGAWLTSDAFFTTVKSPFCPKNSRKRGKLGSTPIIDSMQMWPCKTRNSGTKIDIFACCFGANIFGGLLLFGRRRRS